jgi:drug/metabolite transporter (DMT)-like permease
VLWVPITIAAAFLQTLRNAAQRGLAGQLSALGATSTRFIFGFPFALLYCAALFLSAGTKLPHFSTEFLVWVGGAALLQILATLCLLHLFKLRNFSSGVVLQKSEVLLVALFGFAFLGDAITLLSVLAIVAATIGLLIVSGGKAWLNWRTFVSKPGMFGLGAGAGFAIAAVGYRAGSLSLTDQGLDFLRAAAMTLVVATFLQSVTLLIYLKLREPGQISALFGAWRKSIIPGAAGAAASACWFTASTLQITAYVRMVGLIEILFGFAFSAIRFGERPSKHEVVGATIMTLAILVLLAERAGLIPAN